MLGNLRTTLTRNAGRFARPGLGARGVPMVSGTRGFSTSRAFGGIQSLVAAAAVTAGVVMGLGMLATTEPPSTTTKIERKKSIKTLKSMPIKAEAKEEVSKEKPKRRSAYSVSIGSKMPDEVQVFVEVSKGSRNKYEWDDALGHIVLDRVLHSAVFYPHNYGFVPQTLCGDGDPLDVLIIGDDPLEPGCFVDVRPIGYLVMQDEKGMDEKLLAVTAKDPRLYETRTLRNVPEHILREITQFFTTYKTLEKDKWVKVGGWKGTVDAKLLIESTHRAYLEAKKESESNRVFDYTK
ncbi:hypothetical protein AAMO2058_000171900 [Amorphochlora amoebiformis]